MLLASTHFPVAFTGKSSFLKHGRAFRYGVKTGNFIFSFLTRKFVEHPIINDYTSPTKQTKETTT